VKETGKLWVFWSERTHSDGRDGGWLEKWAVRYGDGRFFVSDFSSA
jgi:hypothetical protein